MTTVRSIGSHHALSRIQTQGLVLLRGADILGGAMEKNSSQPRWMPRPGTLAVLGLALLVRIVYAWQLSDKTNPFWDYLVVDEAGYHYWAQQYLQGRFSETGVFYQEPLYTFILAGIYAVIGPAYFAVRYLHWALGILNAYLFLRLGERVGGKTAGLTAGLIAACYPPFLFFEGMLLKSVWEITAGLLGFFALLRSGPERKWSALVAGLALGAMILLRGQYLALLPVFLGWLVWRQGARLHPRTWMVHWRPAALFGIGMLVWITPVALHNRIAGDDWVLLSAHSGLNLYIGNNPDNRWGGYWAIEGVTGNPREEAREARVLAERIEGRELKPSEVSAFYRDQALAYVVANPVQAAGQMLTKTRLFFNRLELAQNQSMAYMARFAPLLKWPLPGFWLVAPLFLLGLFILPRRPEILLLQISALTYAAGVILVYVTARYRLPVTVMAIPLAGCAADWLIGEFRTAPARRKAVATVTLALAAVAVNIPALDLSATMVQGMREEAKAWEAQEQYAKAARVVEELLERQPADGTSWAKLGMLRFEAAKYAESAKAFSEALRLGFADPMVRFNYALSLAKAGRREEALQAVRQARRLMPGYEPARLLEERLRQTAH